jgi:hypothetical protein
MPEPEHRVEKKVIVESSSATSSSNSVVAWVIIGVLAVALIIYILVRLT